MSFTRMHTCLPLLIAWLSLGILSVWAADPFVENTVTRIELRIPSEGIQTLRQSYFHRRMPAMSHRPKVKGSCLLYTSPSPRDATLSRMPSSA